MQIIMGYSIDIEKVNFKNFKEDLIKTFPQINDEKLLDRIMFEFGTLCGDDFIILHNEYFEDGICTWNMFYMIENVFKLDKQNIINTVMSVWFKQYEKLTGYKELGEAYENLGLKMLDDEDIVQ